MDAIILLINNGYNPFTGQGGLGYKPPIGYGLDFKGRGGLGYKLPKFYGRGLEDDEKLENELQLITMPKKETIIQPNIINEPPEQQIENEQLTVLPNPIDTVAKPKISKKQNELIREYSTFINDEKNKDSLINRRFLHERTKNSNNDTNLRRALIEVINKGLDLIVKNPTVNTNKINDSITNYVSELNELVLKGNKYKIENNQLVEVIEEKTIGEFESTKYSTSVAKARDIVNKYWKKGTGQEIKKTIINEDSNYEKKINKYIREIKQKENEILNNIIPEPEYKKAETFAQKFPDRTLGYAYMDTIKVGNKNIFIGKNINETNKLKENAYNDSGKPAEFSICGINNPLAKKIFNVIPNISSFYVNNPNVQITDYIVDDIFKRQGLDSDIGKQFCIDNVDTTNNFFSESKDYKGLNYKTGFDLNAQLKEVYYNELIVDLDKLIAKYILEEDEEEKEALLNDIKAYKATLTDKDEFDKDFYKNRHYIGIGVTMNKFNKIEIPEDYDYDDSPSNEKQMTRVMNSQGQRFIPVMEDRYIVKILRKRGKTNKEEADFFDINFNKEVIKNPMKYYITTNFSKVLGTYNYTDDDLVENDFILGTYKTAYPEDDRTGAHYNGVLIPIEKFNLAK